ncbi:hypothetical protein [Vibrio sp. YYF0003]|uniref:hypothetical protein n=1 Tax=Vibrio sp. YYF0003 TaxID=3116646 RepID=UPI002EC2BB08|nr:hypothetical protein [Vibrio sp. YYF0003]
MNFGFFNNKNSYKTNEIKITPLESIHETLKWLQTDAPTSHGYIYPALESQQKFHFERDASSVALPQRYIKTIATHRLEFTQSNQTDEKARFIILGLGFFNGQYLTPEGQYQLTRMPYEEAIQTGVYLAGADYVRCLELLSMFYDKNPCIRKQMFTVMHWFLCSQYYIFEWDIFDAQYKVLDGLYKLCESSDKYTKHSERPKFLVDKYDTTVPEWIKSGTLARVRNDYSHEALYCKSPVGYCFSDNLHTELKKLNTKLIAAALGAKSDYLKLGCDRRQTSVWNLQ